jgi:hypothetical protein
VYRNTPGNLILSYLVFIFLSFHVNFCIYEFILIIFDLNGILVMGVPYLFLILVTDCLQVTLCHRRCIY